MKLSNNSPEENRAIAEDRLNTLKNIFYSEFPPTKKDYLANMPLRYLRLYLESLVGKSTAKKAIKAKCLDCANYQKEEVKNCSVRLCPLWNQRPYV